MNRIESMRMVLINLFNEMAEAEENEQLSNMLVDDAEMLKHESDESVIESMFYEMLVDEGEDIDEVLEECLN